MPVRAGIDGWPKRTLLAERVSLGCGTRATEDAAPRRSSGPEGVEDRVEQGRRERGVLGTRATEDAAPRRSSTPSVAGYGGDEAGHVFGFLALIEQRRHLAEPARAPFRDRALARAPCAQRAWRCPRRRGCRGSGRCAPRTWWPTSVWQTAQEWANSSLPFCLAAVQLDPARPPRSPCASPLSASTSAGTTRPKANRTTTPSVIRRWPARDSVCSAVARAARAAAHRHEEDAEAEQQPEERNSDEHAARKISGERIRTADRWHLSRSRGRTMRGFSALGAQKARRYAQRGAI